VGLIEQQIGNKGSGSNPTPGSGSGATVVPSLG
jgi:hypothetical protein